MVSLIYAIREASVDPDHVSDNGRKVDSLAVRLAGFISGARASSRMNWKKRSDYTNSTVKIAGAEAFFKPDRYNGVVELVFASEVDAKRVMKKLTSAEFRVKLSSEGTSAKLVVSG